MNGDEVTQPDSAFASTSNADMPGTSSLGPFDGAREEAASVEVTRWGTDVWLTIRSEDSVGKAIALTREEAREVANLLIRSANSGLRKVRDEPQA